MRAVHAAGSRHVGPERCHRHRSGTGLGKTRVSYKQELGLSVVGTTISHSSCPNGAKLRLTVVSEVAQVGYTVLGWPVADISTVVRGP